MRLIYFFVVITTLALLATGGYFAYRQNQNIMTMQSASTHEAIALGFANSTWKIHRPKIGPLVLKPSDIEDNIDIAIFVDDVRSYFANLPVKDVAVYNASQQLLTYQKMASGGSGIAPLAGLLIQTAASKKPTTILIPKPNFSMISESMIPLMRDGSPELFIAVSSDVSTENAAFIRLLGEMFVAVAVVILGLFLVNIFASRRAENIISKQYEENADLIAQASMAKEENQQKSQFLANITHELRTPLNAIIGFSDILKNEFVPTPEQASHTNYIHDIHSAGTHLLALINDILDFSKAEAGKLELEVTEVNAAKTIQNCIRLIQPRAELAQVITEEKLPKEAMTIMTDGKKFKQILLNLLSNSVKFTPAGGKVTVSAWPDMKDDSWVFEVRDTGIGIAPKDISRAMSPFGQVDNALSRKFEGTGLGLPLTKKFVELMGGTFAIESALNKGTIVTFSLPRELKEREGIVIKQVA